MNGIREVSPPQGEPPAWAACAIELLRYCAARGALPADVTRRLRESCPSHLERLAEARIDSLYYLGCAPESPNQRVYDAVWQAQRGCLVDLISALEAEGVCSIVFKGADVIPRHFGERSVGLLSDVDLLVDRADLGRVKRVAFSSGYRQARYVAERAALVDVDVVEAAAVEARHYELFPFCKLVPLGLSVDAIAPGQVGGSAPIHVVEDECFVAMELDIHHQVALDIASRPFFDRKRSAALGLGDAMSAADHLWFITARLYNEVALHGKGDLRDFAYVVAILRGEAIDWDVVLRAAAEHELRPALFYYLSFLGELCGAPAPAAVLEALSPLRGARLRDFGWQLARLFDVVDQCPLARRSAL